MIEATNIHKYYNNLHVLKGVDLKVRKKEIISIVGPSGAGKTTLLQILGTITSPSKNEKFKLEINSKSIISFSNNELAKFRNESLGFIFQSNQLLPEFSAIENVCIPAYIKGDSKKNAEIKAEELLDFLQLKDRLKHMPSELSGGEQQRVAVARALINDPLVVLADEPSGNLDSKSANLLHKLFIELRETFGHTYIIVTHNEKFAEMADRKITIIDGQIA
tara:strand:- start:87806 stop:88465 length:660 start_codon:yes stop_codon:yes gene_type:complete